MFCPPAPVWERATSYNSKDYFFGAGVVVCVCVIETETFEVCEGLCQLLSNYFSCGVRRVEVRGGGDIKL